MMAQDSVCMPARTVPVLAEVDVVVCGGGPAGCAAAIGAARHGADTLLVEKDGYLGGATVSQLVSVILSSNGADFQGVWHDYIRALRRRNGVRPIESRSKGLIWSSVDPEQVKFAWDELATQAGARLLHHAQGCTCAIEDGKAVGVFCTTRAGMRFIRAQRVIDCTGDGIVAAESGVPFESGDGEHPWAMSLTKVFRLGHAPRPEKPFDAETMKRIETDLRAAIARGEYDAPALVEVNRFLNYLRGWMWEMPSHRGEMLSVLSRVLKVDPLDPWEFTQAEREGRELARQAADACRRFVPGMEHVYLLDTSNQIGLRSSRRLRGIATVTRADALLLNKYPDGIARSSWGIDIWPADSYSTPANDPNSDEALKARHAKILQGDYFDIRYGALVAQGVDNLLMAGRCLSADHVAESSLRIQQTCMATGEAAGVAAALSLTSGTIPRELDAANVVMQLAKDRDIEPAFPAPLC